MITSSVYEAPNSFSRTVIGLSNDSASIENAADSIEYVNSDKHYFKDTENNLKYNDNYLLHKYFHQILKSCHMRPIKIEERPKFNYRPEMLSTEEFGTPELWYILLKVNGCEDASEFKDLNYALIPDLGVIHNCIRNEEKIASKKIK